jgi:hypothetical protein
MRQPAAADLRTTRWSHRLSPQHVVELDTAMTSVRRSERPLLSVRRSDVALPSLSTELRRIAGQVDERDGFAVVHGLTADRCSAYGLRLLLWAVGQHLGTPVPQTDGGHMVRTVSVADGGSFTTGGSDVTAFLVPAAGVRASFVSVESLVREIEAQRPDLAERLSGRYAYDGETHGAGDRPHRLLPLTCRVGGRLSMRYVRAQIEAAHARPDVPSLDPADVELFDLIDEIASDERHRVDVDLEPGDLVLVDNYSTLHMLDAGTAANPQLLRLWITLPAGRELPAGFTWESPGIGGGGRGGVVPRDVICLPPPRGSDASSPPLATAI